MLIALSLLDAMDDCARIVCDMHEIIQFDEINSQDQHSIERISCGVIRSKDPIIVTLKVVSTAYHQIILTSNVVLATNDDVVVLDEAFSHLLQKIDYLCDLLVN